MRTVSCLLLIAVSAALAAGDEKPFAKRGTAQFLPTATEAHIAMRFRLPPAEFDWNAEQVSTASDNFEIWNVTFPSPVKTAEDANNTVHCEYFRCRKPGQRPAVIVLHILGGDFPLSRLFCNTLAQHGVHALFLKMPYYGPRRDPASRRRMVSPDPHETVAGMTQAVLDIRHAAAWLAGRQEVDAEQLGIFGISLGGITAALAATVEPRINNVCLLLAGGAIGQAGWDSAEAKPLREQWIAKGGTREQFVEILSVVDPVSYAMANHGKRILMLNASDDEVIPRACTESLWTALGQPPIKWYPGGHYSVVWHLIGALWQVGRFFAAN